MVAVRWLVWALARVLLSLRYRVRVRGLEALAGLGRGGKVLILPNHPGYTDPLLVLSRLGPTLQPRPLVFEGTFDTPVLWPLMKVIDALRVPDMEAASAAARQTAEGSVRAIIDGLNAGRNHILWPSGRLQRRGVEVLGGARALTDILDAVPDAEVVLVRTRGLWGSVFTFAYTGKLPDLTPRMLGGLGTLLANLLFLTPRRDITITVERLDRSALPGGGRNEVNAFFERWYNAEGPEEPRFVPYHFAFGRRRHDYPKLAGLADVDVTGVKPEVRAEVVAMLEEKLKRPMADDEKEADTTLDALGLDSLDRMELALAVEQRFGFATDQVPATVGQCVALAAGLVEKGPPRAAPPAWFRKTEDPSPPGVLGETVPEAFVARCRESRGDAADADDVAGCLTYERLLVGAVLLARRFEAVAAANVGLMMPASVAGDVAFFGLHLAGKLPVLLNWTTGPANLAHAARTTGLTHVVTSRRFLDRTGLTIDGVSMLCLEDVRPGRLEALRKLARARFLGATIRVPRPDPDSPAVVLFTSGSEKAPKAVPLTHRNLIACIRDGVRVLGMTRGDSLLGFLPAFHSFGLTVTSLAPLLCGLRVVRHPDPTDAASLVRKVEGYGVTVLAGTPTFVSFVFDRVKGDELRSLRTILVGAERCPAALFERAARLAPGAVVLEGYGITECSPVVSINTRDGPRPGTVGRPMPSVATRVVDEAGVPVAAGE
ncbi:MAG: AMP-binding protein, partial [Gemmataceae bacterium]